MGFVEWLGILIIAIILAYIILGLTLGDSSINLPV